MGDNYRVAKKLRRVFQQRGEDAALQAAVLMHQGQLISLDDRIALDGAKRSIDHRLPLADSIVLETTYLHQAVFWTQDTDFADIKVVKYINKG